MIDLIFITNDHCIADQNGLFLTNSAAKAWERKQYLHKKVLVEDLARSGQLIKQGIDEDNIKMGLRVARLWRSELIEHGGILWWWG